MRKLWSCALALALVLTIAGCGAQDLSSGVDSSEAGFTPRLDPETTCSVNVVGNYRNFESLEAEFDRFNACYPNVELSYTFLDKYNSTIGPALKGEDAPDIYCMFRWMVDRENWKDLFDSAEDLSDPALGIDLGCVREGLLYRSEEGHVPMVPVFSTTYGMLVNEDLFKREGLAIPTNYGELIAVCETLKERGYPSPVMGHNSSLHLFYPLAYPFFCATLRDQPETVAALNAMEPSSAEAMRPTLELVQDFFGRGAVDLSACSALEDNYQAVILRFFEGDVPMMFVPGDTVSGTQKRESLSEAYMKHPFTYSFHPVPSTETGGFFLNVSGINFAVNRKSDNLEMANEFMRFLICTEELNLMAQNKRLMTVSTDFSLDGVYASFGLVPADHCIYEQELGLLDDPAVQLRIACWQVGNKIASIDEAIAGFGTLTE